MELFLTLGSCCFCVCVCVCLSVMSCLTSGASVRPENAATYFAGNEGQKIVVLSLKSMCFRH